LLGIDFLGMLVKEGDFQSLEQINEKNLAEQVRHRHNGVRISLFRGWPEGGVGNFCGSAYVLKERREDAMRAHLANLTPKIRMLIALPLVAIAYPVIMILLPAIVRAIVPDVVRSVLKLI